EVLTYRDRHRKEFMEREAARETSDAKPTRPAGRGPTWEEAGSRYVDMAAFGTSDIAGATAKLPAVLASHNNRSTSLVDQHGRLGLLGERLPAANWLYELRQWGAERLAELRRRTGPA